MKRLLCLVALAACSGTIGHNGALEMRYGGALAIGAGALTAVAPKLNGDPFGTGTTVAGASLAIAGLALLAASLALDPKTPPAP